MSSPNRPGPGQSPLLRKTLELNLAARKKSASFKWGLINGLLFAIFSYDLWCMCSHYKSYYHMAEYALATIFGLNAVYHIVRYIYLTIVMSPVSVNPIQKKLLGFKEMDTSYKLTPTSKPHTPTPQKDQSEPFNISSRSWMSGSSPNTSHQSVTSTSWSFQRGSPNSLHDTSASFNFTAEEEFISDKRSLDEYLRKFEEKEIMNSLNTSMEGNLWSPAPDLGARMRNQYQLAPLNTSTSATEDGGCGSPGQSGPHVWWRLHPAPHRLTQWNLNLRLWISATILERIVKEITLIDDALHKHGFADVKIGLVGLERLRKTASGSQAARHVPTLAALVPFLELDNNQEYLVQRIRELSSGGVVGAFKWNGGGTFKDKPWDDSLPTDAELIMHLLATYLDTQLLPVTQNPDGRPFTSQHFFRTPVKPPRSANTLAIHQATLRPPHFVLYNGEEAIEVAKGRNNLIHTVLLFLHMVVTKHHGMLGRVNLGKSGVNILWVIDR